MKTVNIEHVTLDTCVQESQHGRVVVTRNGSPVALVVGIEGMDEEQVALGSSDKFWKLISERRRQKPISRAELEQELDRMTGADPSS